MFKYLKLLLRFKDVSKVYKEENFNKEKPWWLSRRFFGAVITFVGVLSVAFFGVDIDVATQNTLVDNVGIVAESLDKIIPSIITLYGIILGIVGTIKKLTKGE